MSVALGVDARMDAGAQNLLATRAIVLVPCCFARLRRSGFGDS